LLNLIRRFSACRSGATAIEYALIAAGIAIVLVGVLQSVGTEVQGPFTDATTGLQKRVSP
jgi:pilus assembly protein Flp/PilA